VPAQHFSDFTNYDIGQDSQQHIGQMRTVAFLMVFQPFSDVLSISNIPQAIWQSNEKNLGH
jgi:hypothetical protein